MKFLDRLRQIGRKVVGGAKWLGSKARKGVNWVKRMGTKVRNFVGKVPIIGGLLQKTVDRLANTPFIFGYSARDILNKAEQGVSGFENLTADAERLLQSRTVEEAKRNATNLYKKARKNASAIKKEVQTRRSKMLG